MAVDNAKQIDSGVERPFFASPREKLPSEKIGRLEAFNACMHSDERSIEEVLERTSDERDICCVFDRKSPLPRDLFPSRGVDALERNFGALS